MARYNSLNQAGQWRNRKNNRKDNRPGRMDNRTTRMDNSRDKIYNTWRRIDNRCRRIDNGKAECTKDGKLNKRRSFVTFERTRVMNK